MRINNENTDHLDKEELQKLSNLLDRYIQDKCTSEERNAVEQWYESLSGESEPKISEEVESKTKIWLALQHRTVSGSNDEITSIKPFSWIRWAASIVFVCLVGFFTHTYFKKETSQLSLDTNSPEKNWIKKTNTTESAESLVLPDGSVVSLNPRSTIVYPAAFNDTERIVQFKGEAFFDIQKDPSKPFKVITGDITTRVLGTTFIVKADDQSKVVEVKVRTGKVSVYEHNSTKDAKGDGVILTPNQKVTYYHEENKWITELVSDPLPVVVGKEEKSSLIFKDNVMKDVLDDIGRAYGIEIIVANDRIYDCTFTGDVSSMELYNMLRVICKSIRANYEIRGTRILINGDGCSVN